MNSPSLHIKKSNSVFTWLLTAKNNNILIVNCGYKHVCSRNKAYAFDLDILPLKILNSFLHPFLSIYPFYTVRVTATYYIDHILQSTTTKITSCFIYQKGAFCPLIFFDIIHLSSSIINISET